LTAFCALVDLCRSLSYLETDKSENVHFYQKYGFTVVGKADVLGIPNWFMSRPPGITFERGYKQCGNTRAWPAAPCGQQRPSSDSPMQPLRRHRCPS